MEENTNVSVETVETGNVDVTPETTIEETGVDTTETGTETTVDNDNEVTEDKPFNPDEFDFSDEELIPEEERAVTEFEGYNLDKYADKIDFTDPKVKEIFNQEAKFYKDNGFTQEQIEALLDKEIQKTEQYKANLDKQIAEDLKSNLTAEEKRNYKQVGLFVKDILGDELGAHYKGFMGNPILVKIANKMYKKSLGGKTSNLNIKGKGQNEGMSYTANKAVEEFQKGITSNNYGGDMKKFAKSLLDKVSPSEKEQFKNYLGSILN